MGNISSRQEDVSGLYLKDQSRFFISSLVIVNGRGEPILNISPAGWPASRLVAKRQEGDETPVTFILDPHTSSPSFIPQIDLEDDLIFRFTFSSRQNVSSPSSPMQAGPADTSITGLTFAFATTPKELDTLVTREFHADPNIHKNSQVHLIGDYNTNGQRSIDYNWTWKWSPPKPTEDKGGGWRCNCAFLDYDSRAHRLNTLASFAFWVNNNPIEDFTPVTTPMPEGNLSVSKQRLVSSRSYYSAVSDSETQDPTNPPSPSITSADVNPSSNTLLPPPPQVFDISCQRPGEDMSSVEDGPVFRATMKSLEQKTGNMRVQMKKVWKKAEAAQQAQVECNQAMVSFLHALREASGSNATAFKPALDNYFTKIAERILQYETDNGVLLQKQIIEPIAKLYNFDIKQAEAKKKDFEEESRDYYAYVSRYLGQRQEGMKEKKKTESDTKYQHKKRNFELKRFDYSSFMQDLHGGRKEQELLSQLTRYADGQAKSFLLAARRIEELKPQLDALVREVSDANKEYDLQKTEREEKRRNIEKNTPATSEGEGSMRSTATSAILSVFASSQAGLNGAGSDTDLSRAESNGSAYGPNVNRSLSPGNSVLHSVPSSTATSSVLSSGSLHSSTPSKFKGIRDLEERESNNGILERTGTQQRKEGLLWALSRPGSHIDPKGINKQAWHKFWIVLDQGKLSEYSNWKDRLDLHREPIDLRVASVRTARDAERRFCFEVITPHFKRIYQATTEEEMNNWINSINNALQSAVEGRSTKVAPPPVANTLSDRQYGAILTGKSPSQSGPHGQTGRPETSGINRRITVGARPSYIRTSSLSFEDNPTKLLQQIRNNDHGNKFCADCGSGIRVEWVSLNLGIILCIECGGIHRSLGTHVSKIRSLTLDTQSFTTDIVELLLLIGNRISNMVWEARPDPNTRLDANASRDQRLRYITAKYVERLYVAPALNEHSSSVDDMLITSIRKNEIQAVLQSIAQRANVNAHDKSRNTHAVFLALAAADPALPASPPAIGTNPAKAFAVAELLIQNGAEIPVDLPAIPLSAAARLYIDQRTTRATTAVGSRADDTLGPLPNVTRQQQHSGAAGFIETTASKLQKRGSAGARFAGKVTGLGDR